MIEEAIANCFFFILMEQLCLTCRAALIGPKREAEEPAGRAEGSRERVHSALWYDLGRLIQRAEAAKRALSDAQLSRPSQQGDAELVYLQQMTRLAREIEYTRDNLLVGARVDPTDPGTLRSAIDTLVRRLRAAQRRVEEIEEADDVLAIEDGSVDREQYQLLDTLARRAAALIDWLGEANELEWLRLNKPEAYAALTTTGGGAMAQLPAEAHRRVVELATGGELPLDEVFPQWQRLIYDQQIRLPEWLRARPSLLLRQPTYVPPSLAQFTRLAKLTMQGDGTQRIQLPSSWPASLVQSLRDLSVWRYTGVDAVDSVAQLTNLERLDLSHDNLSTVPDGLGGLLALRTLDLSHNQLTTLPDDELAALPKLERVLVSSNRLTAMPARLKARLGARLDTRYNPLRK